MYPSRIKGISFFKYESFFNFVNIFTVTFDKINVSLLNLNMNSFAQIFEQ